MEILLKVFCQTLYRTTTIWIRFFFSNSRLINACDLNNIYCELCDVHHAIFFIDTFSVYVYVELQNYLFFLSLISSVYYYYLHDSWSLSSAAEINRAQMQKWCWFRWQVRETLPRHANKIIVFLRKFITTSVS